MSEPETKATLLKWLARGIAALLALLGAIMLFFAAAAFLSPSPTDATPRWVVPLLGLIIFLLGGMLLRTAFLVWFRWSPSAARRLLQAAFFFVFVFAIPILGNLSNSFLGLLLFAAFGIGALLVYRRTAEYFCRHAFTSPPHEEVHSKEINV